MKFLPAFLPSVVILLEISLANLSAQNFTTLHVFAAFPSGYRTNSDGENPSGSLVLSGGTLYGTAGGGGTNGEGTVYSLGTNGSNFNLLYTFPNNESNDNADGANPAAGLALVGGVLYGTASEGGTNGTGTIFTINTNGDDFAVLYTFAAVNLSTVTNSDGADSAGGFAVSGRTLYGTTFRSGPDGGGTVFSLNTNGSIYYVLHALAPATDGSAMAAGVLFAGNSLYGTASMGGAQGNGTVFSLNTNGTDFTVLHDFTESSSSTNSDGENPMSGLTMSGNTLYGTTPSGGTNGNGTIFALTLSSVPTPIPLNIRLAGPNAILSWSNNPPWYLYAAPTLTGAYSKISNAVSPYTNSLTGPEEFFRLHSN